MKKIKLSCPSNICHFERQTPGFSCSWGDYQFFINEEIAECDAWVVCEGLPTSAESTSCPPDQTIFISSEPYSIWRYERKFLKQFAKIITCQREIKGPNVTYSLQGHGWHVGAYQADARGFGLAKAYDELISTSSIPKTKLLSIISSNKQDNAGHRQRYRFALALKQALGDQADIFGRGINDFQDKWEVLAPYKYSVAIENCANDDYITEKLNDCFLAHAFPFYYGAPNIAKYFSASSYELIDINDLARSLKKITTTITDDKHYDQHLSAVISSKLQYLNHYQLFPLVVEFLAQHQSTTTKEAVVLHNYGPGLGLNNYLRIATDKLKNLFLV